MNKLQIKMFNKSDPKTFSKEILGIIPYHELSDRERNLPTFSPHFLALPIFKWIILLITLLIIFVKSYGH